MKNINPKDKKHKLPIITLDIVLLPTYSEVYFPLPSFVTKDKKQGIEIGASIVVSGRVKIENKDYLYSFYNIGVAAEITKIIPINPELDRIYVTPYSRAIITAPPTSNENIIGECEFVQNKRIVSEKTTILENALTSNIKALLKFCSQKDNDYYEDMSKVCSPEIIPDFIVSLVIGKNTERQAFLEIFNYNKRLSVALNMLGNTIINLNKRSAGNKDSAPSKSCSSSCKTGGDEMSEIAMLEQRLLNTPMTDDANEVAAKELRKLKGLQPGSQEENVVKNYLELILSVPWVTMEEESPDIKKSAKILEDSHYGMQLVKDTIVELLSVRKLSKQKGKIICLVGPPGVGKTSIAKSIAEATCRKYVKIALGGVRDEADIRGHRRTYVGAMPGNIIKAVIKAGKNNPLILLDEIDKLCKDSHGDPASALLEALDPEQNVGFTDHYLDIPFNGSNILYVTTANDISVVDPALRDRMIIIDLSSYTPLEKFYIAKNYLVKKQREATGLGKIIITDPALKLMINEYTREAGVRGVEKKINRVFSKIAQEFVMEGKIITKVLIKDVQRHLGAPIFKKNSKYPLEAGEARGLAWTSLGGEVLTIQASITPNVGKLETSGNLGKTMDESLALARNKAFEYVNSKKIKIKGKEKKDPLSGIGFSIHVPAGGTPKDGPSAGITAFTAIVSELLDIKVRDNVAMTGEICGKGKVLPVGGLRNKLIAAEMFGVEYVILSEQNRGDAEILSLPAEISSKLTLVYVRKVEEVLKYALVKNVMKSKLKVKNQ